jgi:2-phospho-L-lactate guanylyltransferase
MAQAIIAVRGGPQAKSRCAAVLDGGARAALAAAMLQDMLAATAACAAVSRTWVVTPTAELAELAVGAGARAIVQTEPMGLNPAFEQALAEVADQAPYEAVAMLPGDLPLLEPDDLAAAILLLATHDAVLAPSVDGGTGLLARRAGVSLGPAFGDDSGRRHADLAVSRGLSLARVDARSLRHDLDRPQDFALVRRLAPRTATAALLRRYGRPRLRL